MSGLVRRNWCEEHNRGSLAVSGGLCVECQQQTIDRLRAELDGRVENEDRSRLPQTGARS